MTTRADAPVLTRLATLRLLGNEGVGPTQFAMTPATDNNRSNYDAGHWYAGRVVGEDLFGNDIYENFTPEVLASVLVEARDIRLAVLDANDQAINPNLILDGGQLFVYGPDDAVVTFTIDDTLVFGSDSAIAFDVSGGTLTGTDWTLAAGGTVTFALSSITSIKAGSPSSKEVWCRISERGAESGLLAIQAVESNIVIRESAEFVIRYIPLAEYATIQTITDDYLRMWTVTSSRAILDRRYLSLECYR